MDLDFGYNRNSCGWPRMSNLIKIISVTSVILAYFMIHVSWICLFLDLYHIIFTKTLHKCHCSPTIKRLRKWARGMVFMSQLHQAYGLYSRRKEETRTLLMLYSHSCIRAHNILLKVLVIMIWIVLRSVLGVWYGLCTGFNEHSSPTFSLVNMSIHAFIMNVITECFYTFQLNEPTWMLVVYVQQYCCFHFASCFFFFLNSFFLLRNSLIHICELPWGHFFFTEVKISFTVM